ncbi:MAG: PqiC family protein [Desulfobacterales bacterium]|jgi:hypothetical protein
MGTGTQQPTENYVLNSLHSEDIETQPVAKLSKIGILVGPVRMALYLDRTDIVIRDSQNQIRLADFSQWAGPLQENFSRVLAENLSVLLVTHNVGIFPGTRAMSFDYNVTVDVTRFDGIPGERADLRARWAILDKSRKNMLLKNHSVLTQPTMDDSMEALIAAESRALADLSREIAEAIKALAEKKPKGKNKP